MENETLEKIEEGQSSASTQETNINGTKKRQTNNTNIVISIIVIAIAVFIVWNNLNKIINNNSEVETSKEGFHLYYGELLDVVAYDDYTRLVIKAKIEKSLTNKTTINNNYYDVAYLITDQGADKFDEIQYWAVADMTNGEENKVISFTLNKDVINKIKEGKIQAQYIGENAEDLYILPSLLE